MSEQCSVWLLGEKLLAEKALYLQKYPSPLPTTAPLVDVSGFKL